MTLTERSRLLELLTKQLRAAERADNRVLFTTTWKLLWAMGAQVLIQDDNFLVITPK